MHSTIIRFIILSGLFFPAFASAATPLNLIAGWNLLGNSSSAAIDVAATFGDATKITTVWKWNKLAGKWAFFSPSMAPAALTTYAQSKGYDVLSSIASKEGFWVNASTGAALTGPVASGVMTLVESDLQQGWNLLGSADNKTPPQLNAGLSGSLNAAGKTIVTAWAWDAPNTKWKFYSPAMEASGGLTNYIATKGYLPFSAALSAADGFWLNIGTPVISLVVDVTAGQKPISPYIYGMNEAKESFAKEIGMPLHRWGGNPYSRYNWKLNSFNNTQDWFFENGVPVNDYTLMPVTADQWVAQNMRIGAASLICVPMMGYVANDGLQTTCGFKVSKLGVQNSVDIERLDCGNGYAGPAGTPDIPNLYVTMGYDNPLLPAVITGNDPLVTSKVVDQTFVAEWVSHLKTTFGAASSGGVKFYGLDSEPGLWHETQRDVHPIPLTYAESFSRGSAYAAAIKAVDPGALILGPTQTMWSNFFYASYPNSAALLPSSIQDRTNHGDIAFVPWYLQQMSNYQTAHGIRLLDYLDLHFWPENGVTMVLDNGNPATQALRLRSTRSLWDPTYVDESVIGASGINGGIVRLIPLMHDWVNANYPGTKLALTGYGWGALESINGALTQADSLGIFGREGLDMASLFVYPGLSIGDLIGPLKLGVFETLPGAYAFRMYRNYDGLGGRFGDVSVTASSADQSQLAIYAAKRSSDGATTVMAINKTGNALTGNIALTGIVAPATAQVYRYSAANLTAIVRGTDQAVSASSVSAAFPAKSITLFVIK